MGKNVSKLLGMHVNKQKLYIYLAYCWPIKIRDVSWKRAEILEI